MSTYSNGIYDSPQFFAFAKGAGVFGEAGPEAIMPLTRTSDGSLGVRAINSKSGNGGRDITYALYTKSLFKMTARMERLVLRQ